MEPERISPMRESAPERLWNHDFVLCCVANFMVFFSFYVLMPVLPLYLDDVFHASKSMIGSVLSLYAIACLIFRPFSGFMVDSLPRKIVLVASLGVFFVLFGGYLIAGTILTFAIVRALHGLSYGGVSVSNATVAIDVMPPARRGTGIAYYGVANNLAMCIGPAVSMYLYQSGARYTMIFIIALIAAGLGFLAVTMVRGRKHDLKRVKQPLSFDRFWLKSAWRESINLFFVAYAYGLLTTFLAIYGKEEIGITNGSGTFFLLLAIGIIFSRLFASHWINKGMVTINITVGSSILILGYSIFALWTSIKGYYLSALIIGLGQGMFAPAYQTIFINLAPNSQRGTANSTYLTSWDFGAGAGIMLGGVIVDHLHYQTAFISSALAVAVALAIFQMVTAPHFNRNRLR